jgi:DNA-binding transcriptional MerR regulator
MDVSRRNTKVYLINEVSRRVNLSQKRIREYEREGFIKPMRERRTNNRLYTDFDIAQIRRINQLIHDEGFTLACLRKLLVHAPCWNIFDCQNRTECPAYKKQHAACYEIRKSEKIPSSSSCEQCAIYLNRNVRKDKILEKNLQ